jgi:hypothetical protein
MSALALLQPHDVVAKDALSPDERSELVHHEAVISRYRDAYFEVGKSLLAIRDGRLYRQTHKTFEAYCDEHLGFTKGHANQLIRSVSVVANLASIDAKPKNLAQTRALARLNPDQQREAWEAASEQAVDREITAFDLEQAACRIAPRIPVPKVQSEEDRARAKKRERDRERREQKRLEEEEKKTAERRAQWETITVVVQNRFAPYSFSSSCRPAGGNLDRALAEIQAKDLGDSSLFQGSKWVATIYRDGDGYKVIRRDELEGRSQS